MQPLRGGDEAVISSLARRLDVLNVLCSPVDLSPRGVCDGYPAVLTTMECDYSRHELHCATQPGRFSWLSCSVVTITDSLSVQRPLHGGFMQALPQVPFLHVLHSLEHSSYVRATRVAVAVRT